MSTSVQIADVLGADASQAARRAATLADAVGSKPYRHKAVAGGDKPWCEGAHEPALHFTKSTDTSPEIRGFRIRPAMM